MRMEQYEKDQICPVCSTKAKIVSNPPGCGGLSVECEKCGEYYIDNDILHQYQDLPLKLRSCLYYYLSQQKDREINPEFLHDSAQDGIITELGMLNQAVKVKQIDIESIQKIFPKDIHERIAMIMINLSNEVKYIGNSFELIIPFDPDKCYLFFLNNDFGPDTIDKQFQGIIQFLEDMNYIEQSPYNTHDKRETDYFITPDGWNLIDEYQKEHQILPQAFIAMSFSDAMKPTREIIRQAINESGYVPIFIDEKEHNDQIVPEIFYEIDRSEFVIVDLTEHRSGVYYEAGYAKGVKKTVIMCCREDQFDSIHFDLKQKSAIKWNEDNLLKKLKDRIEATVGKRNI